MKVAIVNVTAGGLCHGYRKYIRTIVPLIKQDASVSSVTVFLPPQAKDYIGLKDEAVYYWPENDYLSGFSWLKRRVRELSPDVVFIPNGQWGNFGGIPTVVMPHNMEPFVFSLGQNSLRIGLANVVRYHLTRRACKRADGIIAVSRFVKDVLISRFRVDPEKIGVVPFGAGPSAPDRLRKPESIEKRGVTSFVFTAGGLAPYRGLEDLIHALSIIKKAGDAPCIVIAGEADPGNRSYRMKIERLAQKDGVSGQLLWAGHLSAEEMTWCYRHSSACIVTSRVEACPNIVLEAMEHGCLNISTDTPPMPEFFGNTAYYYPAGSADILATLIRDTLRSPDADKRSMREAAVTRSRDFIWSTTARQTIAELQRAIDGKSRRAGAAQQ